MSDSLRPPTFAEREGVKPLPTQLSLKEVNSEVRAKVWGLFHRILEGSKFYDGNVSRSRLRNWGEVLLDAWVEIDHKFADEFDPHPSKAITYAKSKMSLGYADFLEFLEFCAQHRYSRGGFGDKLNEVFAKTGFAYRFYENSLVPISTSQEGEAILRALSDLFGHQEGAKSHLLQASSCLSKGQYAQSITQSISAIESVARKLAPSSNKTLTPALCAIEESLGLHPALKRGFSSLYGYTSDEQGVRHALIERPEALVDEADALYMLGACASFASYLLAKSRSINQESGVA